MQVDDDDYQSQIAQMRFGKRVGTSIYFHEECTADLPPAIQSIAGAAKNIASQAELEFNVYKLDTRTPKTFDLSSAMQSNHKRGLVAPNVVGVQLRRQRHLAI